MAEDKSNANPLEDEAAKLSAELEGKSVDIKDTIAGDVQGGHVSMADSAAGPSEHKH